MRYAVEDLQLIEAVIQESAFVHSICFHAQQSAEKYFKGFLAAHEQNVRKVHDLTILLKNCIDIDPTFSDLQEAVDYLNPLYVEARYPGDIEAFSYDEAKIAFTMAQTIQEKVLQALH